jgi:hypothetical protein
MNCNPFTNWVNIIDHVSTESLNDIIIDHSVTDTVGDQYGIVVSNGISFLVTCIYNAFQNTKI